MKKLTVLLVLAVMLVFTMGASAQEFTAENMKFVGGVSYNMYDGSFSSGLEHDVKNGLGFYLGGQYWFDPEMAVEMGYDRAMSEVAGHDASLSGFYGKFVYSYNPMMSLKGGLAYYGFKADSNSVEDGKGIGFLVGGDYKYPMDEGMSLVGSVNYRMANMELDNDIELDMSGLSISGGVCIKY
mgnify:CR=1 FL=1